MKKKCLFCGTEFEPINGSSSYCPESDCYKKAKKARQKIVDDLIKLIRKGLYKNFKFFNELLPSIDNTSILLETAIQRGFDEHAYYKTAIDKSNNITWYNCGNYIFSIQQKNGINYLVIYKN